MTTLTRPPAASTPLDDPHTALRRKLVATVCVCCGKALTTAKSATLGIGPQCARRLGLTRKLAKGTRADDLIARAAIAAEYGEAREAAAYLLQLLTLDPSYRPLVEKTHARLYKIRVSQDEHGFLLRFPYDDFAREELRDGGLRWAPVSRAWRAESPEQLDFALSVLDSCFPGRDALLADGSIVKLGERHEGDGR